MLFAFETATLRQKDMFHSSHIDLKFINDLFHLVLESLSSEPTCVGVTQWLFDLNGAVSKLA